MKHIALMLIFLVLISQTIGCTEDRNTASFDHVTVAYALDTVIASIDEPFRYSSEAIGYCIADGIISDMSIDLDNDDQPERLVVYLAPSGEEGYYLDENTYISNVKDLRLAVLRERDGSFIVCSDIVVTPQLAMFYTDIRISVWGDEHKYIYAYSAIQWAEGVYCTYYVFSLNENRLDAELALISPGFTDGTGLFRVMVRNSENLYRMDYYDGYTIEYDSYNDSSYIPIWDGVGSYADDHIDNNTEHENYAFDSDDTLNQDNNFDEDSTFLPIDWDNDQTWSREEDNYWNKEWNALTQQLSTFGIEHGKYSDPTYCIPICEIRCITNQDEHRAGGTIIDYTDIAR